MHSKTAAKWRSLGFDWNQARAFYLTAEEGSLSAAAKALGTTQSTVGRQVSSLERELGVALFERSSNGLELTPNAIRLLDFVRNMGEAAQNFSLAASSDANTLGGHLCISATEAMATFTLPKLIAELVTNNPGLNIDLIASNDSSDLRRREADIAIRTYRPDQPDLIARKLGLQSYRLYAADCYIQRKKGDISLENSAQLQFIGFDKAHHVVKILNQQGMHISLDNFSVACNHHLANWELVKQGAGIGIMLQDIGDNETGVQQVLPSIELPTTETWLVAHRDLRTNLRLRFVWDFLVERLGQEY